MNNAVNVYYRLYRFKFDIEFALLYKCVNAIQRTCSGRESTHLQVYAMTSPVLRQQLLQKNSF